MILLVLAYALELRMWARLAGGDLPVNSMIAAACGTGLTYILDHMHGSNGGYSTTGVLQVAEMGILASVLVACMCVDPGLVVAFAGFVAVAAFYDTNVPYLGVRVKNLFPYAKTLFVPGMHVAWCYTMAGFVPPMAPAALMFWDYVHLNVCMDIKDVEDDRAKGVVTVPNTIGIPACRRLLLAMQTATIGAALAVGAPFVVLVGSAVLGVEVARLGDTAPPNYVLLWRSRSVLLAGVADLLVGLAGAG